MIRLAVSRMWIHRSVRRYSVLRLGMRLRCSSAVMSVMRRCWISASKKHPRSPASRAGLRIWCHAIQIPRLAAFDYGEREQTIPHRPEPEADRFYDNDYILKLGDMALTIIDSMGPITSRDLSARLARLHGFQRNRQPDQEPGVESRCQTKKALKHRG